MLIRVDQKKSTAQGTNLTELTWVAVSRRCARLENRSRYSANKNKRFLLKPVISLNIPISSKFFPPKDECPTLLVEEPEAHLHPQLVVQLAKYLARKKSPEQHAQAIVSSHSPTFAANVKPSQVSVMFKDSEDGIHRNALARLNWQPAEKRQICSECSIRLKTTSP